MKPIFLALALTGLAALAPLRAAPLTTPASSASAPGTSLVDLSSYVLSPDDQIEISVFNHDELHEAVTILPDGTFSYPILGDVHAAGQTIDGLTRTLAHGLSKRYNSPEVTVYLRQGRARKVSVLGDGSKTTGQFEFKTGMHLLDLLAAAGGPAGEPQLISASLVSNGGQTSTPIQLEPLLTGADPAENLPLAPGDILFLVARNPEVGQVQVVGAVGKPGAYSIMPSGISILALLNEAGGAQPSARLTQAQIMHGGQVQTVNLLPLMTSDLNAAAGKIRLLPGDVLMVPENKNIVLALGQVRTPGVLAIPDDQPLTLTRAYAEVGGATDDGDKKNVSIVRRTPAGKASLFSVNMDDLLKGKNDVTDVTMQPGDILFIQTRNHPKSVGDILGSIGSVSSLIYLSRVGL